nr:Two component regulator three Y domain-containing protein [Allomuricauda sp.]
MSKFLLRLIILLIAVHSYGQNLLPPIYNYKLSEYKGASKNWDLAANHDGELFVANNKGLLYFNGEKWSLNKLPNNTIIRSVEVVGDKIFTGSYEEFGFWVKDDLDNLAYTSLTSLIKDHTFTSEEFWEILPFGEEIYFRSFSSIYSYQNGKIKVLDPTQIISDLLVYNGKLIVGGGTEGLFELQEDQLQPLAHQELLVGKTITDVVPIEEGLLVGTKLNGCFVWNGSGLTSWNNELNSELKRHQLNKILKLSDNQLAFGTIKNGVYLFDAIAKNTKLLNRETGLQNNTVLSMLQFQNQLWLGLDNGLARTKLNHPITYFTDFTGTLGMVYDMAYYDDRLYLGSNTGVYYFEDNALKFLDGSQGHVWDLEVVDGDLLCGNNTGTYRIKGSDFEKISDVSGGYGFAKVPEQSTTYIQGTYTGLVKYSKQVNGAWTVTKIDEIVEPVKHLCFETPNILWATHAYKGFYRIKMDSEYQTVLEKKEYLGEGTPSPYNIKVYNIKNQIVFRGEQAWYKYDPILDRIVVFDDFEPYSDHELLHFDDSHFWFVNREGKKEIVHTDLKRDSLAIADFPLDQRLAPDSQNVIKINDSTSYITLTDGFAKVDRTIMQQSLQEPHLPVPHLNLLRDEDHLYSGSSESIEIPFKSSQSLSFEVSSPELMQPRYHYILTGPKTYSGFTEDGQIEFQNLPHGEYSLEVSTVGQDNSHSESVVRPFEIAAPWFLSKGSLVLYVFLVVATVLLIRFYNRRKLQRKQRELELQMKKEQEEKLAALEKEKLAREIKLKQNELASTTLNIAKKNEMILELKNMLVINKDKFSNSQRYRSFIKKLNNSIQDTDDWKRFEVNFKELHEDFFERLLKQYPSLTPKDLKLCAYLKMNLSTKEIAPLMAISVRGVEIHRYRLRKKLEIDSSKSLSNFLITF